MLKSFLLIAGGIVVLALIYVGWVISQALRSVDEKVSSTSKVDKSKITIVAILSGADREYEVTEISFPRGWGESMGISSPIGYSAQPYTLADTDAPEDPESESWVNETNEKSIRWVGSTKLAPDHPTSFEFPIQSTTPGKGTIDFVYETKIGISGSISFFSADIEVDET